VCKVTRVNIINIFTYTRELHSREGPNVGLPIYENVHSVIKFQRMIEYVAPY
jgi:hypothetical protein